MAENERGRSGQRRKSDPKRKSTVDRDLESAVKPGAADMETAGEDPANPAPVASDVELASDAGGIHAVDAQRHDAEDFADAKRAVDADIAAANSDMEAAAEDMGARQSLEPAQPGQAGLEQTGYANGPLFQTWPSVPPTFRRSMTDEANAFFAFSQRLQDELQPGDAGNQAPVPIDPPDPDDNAMMGPEAESSFRRTTVLGDETVRYSEPAPAPVTDEPTEEEHDTDDEYFGDGFDADDFYVGYDDDDDDDDDRIEVEEDGDAEDDDPDA